MSQKQSSSHFREVRRLATLKRNDPAKKPTELRMVWMEANGRPYLSLETWIREATGQWEPLSSRSITVRLSEMIDFANGAGRAVMEAVRYNDHISRQEEQTGSWGRKRR